VPEAFLDSSSRTGGQVHRLDADTRDPIVRARRLRALAEGVDFVALHVYPDDIVPLLAFAHRDALPPVAFVHHSDHTFWLGVDISDLVVQLRRCSVPLSIRRRGIGSDRFATLPIPLPPAEQTPSRAEARAQLGIQAGQVVLLSVGTEFKYAPVGGPGFLDVLRPVIERHAEAVLLVVGPKQTGDWNAAYESTGGRIRALGRRYDTAALFRAADVYLDSFPFTSPTAALEAGSYGLPLVAYCPHTGDAQVLSPGAPGLDASICKVSDVDGYAAAVSGLIRDADLRRELGDRARRAIDHHHRGAAWIDSLAGVYRMASVSPPRGERPTRDHFEADTIDLFIRRLYGVERDGLGQFIDQYVRPLPLGKRVAILRRMLRVNRSFSFDLFLPHWCAARLSWRPPYWAAIRKMLAKRDVQPRRTDPCAST
jgi:glycosyltransferase involved in cell wall biosynthesis